MELKHSRKHFTSTLKITSTIIFLETTIFQNQTLETYFQELNFNIIQYCKENYSVEQKFSLSFELETEEGKGKRKQKLRTIPNTLKTIAKHLQTPEQGASFKLPLSITPFPASFAQLEETESEQEIEDSENKEEMTSTYIAKIPEFTREDSETSLQEWLDKVSKAGDANDWNTARIESVMTYLGKFNKLLRRIRQLKTNKYYSNTQILDQFIAGLKDKLIKKVHPHAPEDLATAIQQAKNYEMAMEKANCTKLVNLAIGETSSALKTTSPTNNNNNNSKDINHPKDKIKITLHHFLITSLKIAITVEFLATGKKIAESYNETNKIGQFYYQPPPPAYYLPRPQYQSNYYQPTPQPIQQQYQQPLIQHYQFTPQNQYQVNNNRINSNNQLVPQNSAQPKPNYYYTQPSYLMMPEEQDFRHTALSEGRAAAQQQNPSYTSTTIPPARIAENTNLSDIFPFEFEANKSPFLLSNAAANEQKAITAIYTEAEAEKKPIHLILNSGSARSIITYQLMQQLKRNID
ncbi:hypothetical protein G9A89_006883 [Geosiphon pyriformis]|nr:hypothetical protein G9A89_006883 [Geosiphon pyriformis]